VFSCMLSMESRSGSPCCFTDVVHGMKTMAMMINGWGFVFEGIESGSEDWGFFKSGQPGCDFVGRRVEGFGCAKGREVSGVFW